MLSRVAENLFWISRSVERADNIARLIDTARRMVTLPIKSGRGVSNEWSSILIAAGAGATFQGDLDNATREEAIEHLVADPTNPSSIYNCIKNARENARAIRFGITSEVWNSLNTTWNDLSSQIGALRYRRSHLAEFVDWVKVSQAQYRGAVDGTMVRDDSLEFMRLGSHIERADATARILDVKYHVLLPSLDEIGGHLDQFQWVSLLQAVGMHRAYYFVTKSDATRRGVTEFLIQNERNPRSMAYSVARIAQSLSTLEWLYGREYSSRQIAEAEVETLRSTDIDTILTNGLHEYITAFIERSASLSVNIAQDFTFGPPVTPEAEESVMADVPGMGQSQG